jgi:hypothetical protein
MKTAEYSDADGKIKKIEYDPSAPCIMCGYAVVEASMSGTLICPACDCGYNRFTGRPWTHEEYKAVIANFKGYLDGNKPEPVYEAPSEMLSCGYASDRNQDGSLRQYIWAEATSGFFPHRGSDD